MSSRKFADLGPSSICRCSGHKIEITSVGPSPWAQNKIQSQSQYMQSQRENLPAGDELSEVWANDTQKFFV